MMPLQRHTLLVVSLFLVALLSILAVETKAIEDGKKVVAQPVQATPEKEVTEAKETKKSETKSFYQQLRHVTVEILVAGRIAGMGTFVEADGHIITASHLFDRPGQRIEILSTAIGRHEVRIVAVDRGHDLTLLLVVPNEEEEKLTTPVVVLADAMPKTPESVYQLGAPICRRGVLQSGTMARDDTIFEYLGDQKASFQVTHVCATVQQGTSGGPWVDRKGRLIGVQSATMMVSGAPAGVAFVSPLSAIKKIIKTKKTASTATLGVAVEELWQQSTSFVERFPQRTEGIILKVVHHNGPADRAGVEEMDMVTHVDGKRVRWIVDFMQAVRAHKPGEKVELEIMLPNGAGKEKVTIPAAHLEVSWVKAEK